MNRAWAAVLAVSLAAPAAAQDWYVTLQGGGGFPHRSGTVARAAAGGRLGREAGRIDAGVAVLWSGYKEAGTGRTESDTFFTVAPDWRFAFLPGLRAGPRLGAVLRRATNLPGGGSLTEAAPAGGAGAAYELPLWGWLSVGAGVEFLHGGTQAVTHALAGVTSRF